MTAAERTMTPDGISIKTIDQAVAIITERIKSLSQKDIMTREEAAEYLRYSLSSFDRLVRQGKIPYHVLVGGAKRFIRTELLEFVKACGTKSPI